MIDDSKEHTQFKKLEKAPPFGMIHRKFVKACWKVKDNVGNFWKR